MRQFATFAQQSASSLRSQIVFLEGELICSDKFKVLQRLQRSGYSCLHVPFLPWMSQTYHKNYLLEHSEKDSKMIVNDFNQFIQESISKELRTTNLKNNLLFLDSSPLTPLLYFHHSFSHKNNIQQWFAENVKQSTLLRESEMRLFLCEADEVEAAYRLANHKYETLFSLQQDQQMKPQTNLKMISSEVDYDQWYRVIDGKQFTSLDSAQMTQMMLQSVNQEKTNTTFTTVPTNETKIEIEMVRKIHNLSEELMQQVLQIPKSSLKPLDMSLIKTVDDLLQYKHFLFTTDTRQTLFVLYKQLGIASPTFKAFSTDQ